MLKVWRAATKIAVLSSALLGPLAPTVGRAGEVPLFAQPRPGDEFDTGIIARLAPPLPFALDSAASAHPVAGTGNGGCGTKRIGEITVGTVNNAPAVTLVANGAAVTLLLDTGAGRTILTPQAAQRIGAQPPRIEFDRRMRGIAGALPTREVELRSFTIAGVAIPWRRIAVASITTASVTLDGLLGADVLSYFDVDFDLAHNRIALYEQQSCPVAAPDWPQPYVGIRTGRSANDYLFFPVQLNGRGIGAIVDTGAPRTAISTKTALALGVTEAALAQDRSIRIRGSAGEQLTARIHRFAQLEVGGEITRSPEIIVIDLNLPDADLVLGVDFLRTRRIWFSYGSRQIFLKRVTLDQHSSSVTGM
jgi:predicted aspartyl protease